MKAAELNQVVYLSASDLAKRYGKTARYFQKLAQSGLIPGASQPNGRGSPIYFDQTKVEEWMDAGRLGKKTWQKSSGATASPGRARRKTVWKGGSPLEQRLREKLKSVSSNG